MAVQVVAESVTIRRKMSKSKNSFSSNLQTALAWPEREAKQWIDHLYQSIRADNQRAVLLLTGDADFYLPTSRFFLAALSGDSVLWLSSDIADALPANKARTQLGKEYDAIVFDARAQFDVDAFGAVIGTLRGGGLLLLLLPEIASTPEFNTSRFLQLLWSLLQNQPGVYFLRQGQALPEIQQSETKPRTEIATVAPFCTIEQQQVVAAIEDNVRQQRRCPIVLISDRGRGKSSALGLAAGRLLQQGVKKIIVTAPRLSTCDPVFFHAAQQCPQASSERAKLTLGDAQLVFMAPDALLEAQPDADLLLVDEASAIPLPLLEQFLASYPASVFASTIHGYEGTGRGFVLKFNKVLDVHTPDWQQFKMETPVRWRQGDPVEQWVDKLLCLDAELPEVSAARVIDVSLLKLVLLDRDELIANADKLSSLFGLLVYAHYRTQPSDFRHMLDDPGVRIYTLECQQQILAAVLVNEEGGLDEKLSNEIYRGARRPRGHLLAQTLTFHAGCESAATLRYARVMRIAVHPELQGQGLGSCLLQQVIAAERRQGVDAIGTSFGATPDLLRFWQRSDFALVRMGFTRDHASGSHSAVMLRPLTEQGEFVFQAVRQRFQHYLSSWLAGPLAGLAKNMASLLRNDLREDGLTLSESDWQDIRSFAQTRRGYEACMWPLIKLVRRAPRLLEALTEDERKVIAARIQNNMAWPDTIKYINVSGKAQAVIRLRQAIASLLKIYQLRYIEDKHSLL